MADSFPVIADLLADAFDLSGAQVNDILDAAPFVSQIPMVPSSDGTNHKYIRETTNPAVGFRGENAGREFSKATDVVQTDALKILDWSWAADKAVADAWRAGAESFIAYQGARSIRSAMQALESQILNSVGTQGDAAGFIGLQTLPGLDGLADTMCLGAGGADANAVSSVYLINQSELTGVAGVFKGDGMPISMGQSIVQDMVDGTGKHYPVYYTSATSWFGLQVGGSWSVSRICNIDAGSPLTDDLISQAIALHPVGNQPNVIVANRKTLQQLQASRTATNATGTPAPFPTEAFGKRIIVTDQLTNTEAVVA